MRRKNLLLCLITVACFISATAQKQFKTHADKEKKIPVTETVDFGNGKIMRVNAVPLDDRYRGIAEDGAVIALKVSNALPDETGYQLLLDADGTAYGMQIPVQDQFEKGDIPQEIYDAFEYKLPVNADGAVNTENILIEGILSITVPAGTYDYVVLNPSPDDDLIWIGSDGCDLARGNDLQIQDGYYYTFELSIKDGYDCTTIKSGVMPENPLVTVDKEMLEFAKTLDSDFPALSFVVEAYGLKDELTVMAPDKFEVSTDAENYAQTVTMTTHGTVYVRFISTEAGEFTGNVTFTAEGVNETMAVKGTAIDCATFTLPIEEGFEGFNFLCWRGEQATAYPTNPLGINAQFKYAGNYSWMFSSAEPNYEFNQYLISPLMPVTTNNKYVSFYYNDLAGTGETFAVGYSVTTDEVEEFIWLEDEEMTTAGPSDTWFQYVTVLPAEAKYMAINYRGGNYYLCVDDIVIREIQEPIMKLTPTEWQAGQAEPGSTVTSSVFTMKNIGIGTLTVLLVNELQSPWSTSLMENEVALAADEEYTFTFTYAPTAEGSYEESFNLKTTGGDRMIPLSGVSADCRLTYPVKEDFESLSYHCWTALFGSSDENNENENILAKRGDGDGDGYRPTSGDYCWTFSSIVYTEDDVYDMYLISPLLPETTNELILNFNYNDWNGLGDEKLLIGYSTTTNDTTAFQWIDEIISEALGRDVWVKYSNKIPPAAKYICIRYASDFKYRLLIDDIELDEIVEPIAEISAVSWETGQVKVGAKLTSPDIKIKNIGIGTLTVSSVSVLEAPWTTSFDKDAVSLAPNEEYAFTITYSPAEEGTYTASFEIKTNGGDLTVNLKGISADCDIAYPVKEGFEGITHYCWKGIYASEDVHNKNELGLFDYSAKRGKYSWAFTSNQRTADDIYDLYLVSPLLPETNKELKFSFAYNDYNGAGSEKFRVGYSGTTDEIADFTWLDEIVTEAGDRDRWLDHSVDIPAGTKYVAIHYGSYKKLRLLVDELEIKEINPDNIDTAKDADTFVIYPNPSDGDVMIQVNKPSVIRISDLLGRELETRRVEEGFTLRLQLPSGTYLVNVTTDGKTATQKLIVR